MNQQEIIEIQNGRDDAIKVSACRSRMSGMLYVHINEECSEDPPIEILAHNYRQIVVKSVAS